MGIIKLSDLMLKDKESYDEIILNMKEDESLAFFYDDTLINKVIKVSSNEYFNFKHPVSPENENLESTLEVLKYL